MMIEIHYRNKLESCARSFIYIMMSMNRYKRSVRKKSLALAFLFLVTILYLLDSYLRLREAGIHSVLHVVLLSVSAILFVLSLTYFRKILRKKDEKRIYCLMEESKDTFGNELVLQVDQHRLTMGSEERRRSYPATDVELVLDYDAHLCVALKNGAVLVVPDEYFESAQQRKDVIDLLTPISGFMGEN